MADEAPFVRGGPNDPFDPLGPEDGDANGFVVLAWSGLAAIALLMAMVAWQYGAPDRNVAARTLDPGFEATPEIGIAERSDPSGFTVGSRDASGELGELRVENAGLRHTLDMMRGQIDALSDRVAAMEEKLGDLTGSVTAEGGNKVVRTTTITANQPVPVTQRDRTAVAAAPAAPRTPFGVELGVYRDLAAVQTSWRTLVSGKPDLFGGLSPLAAIRDRGGRTEILLVAGPFDSAASASDLCDRASAEGIACLPAFYLGQPLMIR